MITDIARPSSSPAKPKLATQPKVRSNIVLALDGNVRVRAYLYDLAPTDLDSLLEASRRDFRETLELHSAEDDSLVAVEWEHVKALFFVTSFQGDHKHEGCRFGAHAEVGTIWAEVKFKDGEVLEGYVHNSIHHLIEDGFFLYPSEPDSNNRLVYVNKSAIVGYRVLGMRISTSH